MARSRDISKVLSSNSTLATDAEVAATYQTQAGTGLKKIVPSSVAVGSGTGSADSLGTVTVSGASSVSLNDVFSTTYDVYYIVGNLLGSGTGNLSLRLRASGSDLSTGVYTNSSFSVSNTSVNASRTQSTTSAQFGSLRANTLVTQVTIANPFRAVDKNGYVQQADFSGAVAIGTEWNDARIGIASAVSYTGFTITSSANTMTGTILVYGYTK